MLPTNPIRDLDEPQIIERPASRTEVEPDTWVGYSLGESRDLAEDLPVEGQSKKSRNGLIGVALGALAGAGLSLWLGGQPTGIDTIDTTYLLLFGAMVAACARFCGRLGRVLALVPCVLLPGGWLAAGAVAALLVLMTSVRTSRTRFAGQNGLISVGGSALGPLLVVCYLHLSDYGIPRLSAVAAGLATVVLVVSAIRSTHGRVRGALEIVTMSLLFVVLFGAVNLATVLYGAKSDLDSAAVRLENGLAAPDVRSIEEASTDVILARRSLVAARQSIESTWAGTGRLVPVVAQNYQALVESLDALERSTIAAARAVDSVDASALRSTSGGIDVLAIDEAAGNAREFRQVLDDSARVFEAQRGPWLLPQLRDELASGAARSRDAIEQIDEQLPRLEVLPKLLGAGSPRNYLVLIANPTETRELGGFTGGFAVVRVDDGQIELVQSGRSTDLKASEAPAIDGVVPDRFAQYEPWTYAQNYTGTPDLTVAATTLREVFPAMGGSEIDGVVYIDPYALGALTELTGPITIDALGLVLDATTLPQFLLVDQYALIDDRSARTSVLDVVAAEVFRQLQFGGLPSMGEVIDTMSPMVSQGRLRMVTFEASDTAVLTDLGLTQRFRQEFFDDFLSVMHANGGPNKLDPYLHRTVSYEVTTNPSGTTENTDAGNADESVSAVLQVGLENRAPDGLSDYVTSNRWNLDPATNRLLLIVHSPLNVATSSIDGNLTTVDSYYEYGLWRHEIFVVVPQGETRTVEFELAGRFGVGMVDSDPTQHDLWVHHQPTVTTDSYEVTVDGIEQELSLTESTRLIWPN